MRPRARRRLLQVAAALYAGILTMYAIVWIYAARRGASAYLGVDSTQEIATASRRLDAVAPGTAAARAGLRAGDRILTVNGRGLGLPEPFNTAVYRGHRGDHLRFLVERGSEPRPFVLEAVLGEHPHRTESRTLTRRVANEILGSYPVLFLAVAVPVLLLRAHDRHAWLLALLFSGFIAGAPFNAVLAPPALRGPALAFWLFFWQASPALFLYFFAVFPEPSPLDRRAPWLKTAWLATGISFALPIAVAALLTGTKWPVEVYEKELPAGSRSLL
jgi:hypothetical protein